MNSVAKSKRYTEQAVKALAALPTFAERANGRFSLVRKTVPAGTSIPVVSTREAIFSGMRAITQRFPHETEYYELRDADNGVWMSSQLQEVAQMVAPVKRARGNVLIGGLGMGIIAGLMADSPKVKKVTVVEIEPDLIGLMRPFIHPRVEIVQADLFDYVRAMPAGRFNYAYFDIWQATGEWVWQTMVVPLRRAAGAKVKRVECWQENDMRGQVMEGLFPRADLPAECLANRASTAHYLVWRKGIEFLKPESRLDPAAKANDLTWFPKFIEYGAENAADPYLAMMAELFLGGVGGPAWEKFFGEYWDQSLPWYRRGNDD